MSNSLNLEAWLSERSTSEFRDSSIITYTHFTEERSILAYRVPRGVNSELDRKPKMLQSFYDHFRGASIGNDHIIIGTDEPEAINMPEKGLVLPTTVQMRDIAGGLGVVVPSSECVFMAEAAWMFVYTLDLSEPETPMLYRYDRDFKKKRRVESIEGVLNSWWEIVQEDAI